MRYADGRIDSSKLPPEFKKWLMAEMFRKFYYEVTGNHDLAWTMIVRSLAAGSGVLRYAATAEACLEELKRQYKAQFPDRRTEL